MLFAIPYPVIDPVLVRIGPLAVRWYALAYIVGIFLGWRYALYLARLPPRLIAKAQIDDFVVWATLGTVLGGRLGFIFFYQPGLIIEDPGQILRVWEGGMSFHGGMVGVILAMFLFAWRRGLPFFALTDLIGCVTPIGLFLGRLANFINGELYGRVTDVPWAMVFPNGGPEPRHPSQLYEALLEGIVLFVVMFVLARFTNALHRTGLLSGVFLLGYGTARIFAEFFREPDAYLGFYVGGTTWGQWLSVPMILLGLFLVLRARPVRPVASA